MRLTRRTLSAALAALLIATPVATARPANPHAYLAGSAAPATTQELALITPAVPAIAAGNTSAEPPPPNLPTAVPTRPGALTQPADTHASVAPAATNAHNKHKRRSADANVGTYTPGATPAVAYTSGATAGGAYTPGASAVDSARRPSVPGPPTWPVNPRPIKPVPAVHASHTGSGLDWTTIGLGIAGGLLAIGGIVGIGRRSRRIERARVTA